jgi:hypothetical protein
MIAMTLLSIHHREKGREGEEECMHVLSRVCLSTILPVLASSIVVVGLVGWLDYYSLCL